VLRTRVPAAAPLRVAASRSHRNERTEALLARIAAGTGVDSEPVALGSSLKFCRLAEGGMDVYPRFGPTSEWDTAAGQAILEAAGGCVLDPRGRPFRYNQRDTLLNGDFVALGDPSLPWRDWVAAGSAG
jgi:3'(2'), 5'-bisphosphate nucleotidase